MDLNSPNKEGSTLLHMAAKTGNETLVNYLIDRRADVNSLYSTKVSVTASTYHYSEM